MNYPPSAYFSPLMKRCLYSFLIPRDDRPLVGNRGTYRALYNRGLITCGDAVAWNHEQLTDVGRALIARWSTSPAQGAHP